MAVPSCLRLADDVFPQVRGEVARRLVAAGWTQTHTAAALGLSQAMVSKHASTRPGPLEPLVERLAEDFHRELIDPRPAVGVSSWCAALSGEARAGGDDALRDILAAERIVRTGNPRHAMPQIGINIARALPDAASPDDILAFPGRLVEAGGRIVSPAPPAFGGSGHLARCLLAALARWPERRALANVRGGPAALAAVRRLGWSIATVTRPAAEDARRSESHDAEASVLRAVQDARTRPDAIHDPGAVGIEPCLYVLTADAESAARRILELEKELNP